MSNIAFVAAVETWPEAAEFPLSVLDIDGVPGDWFGDHAEVELVGPIREDGSTLIVSVRFATLDQARHAGRILMGAFAAVQKIEAEAPPEPAACSHARHTWMFLPGRTEKYPVCPACGHVGELISLAEWRDKFGGEA